MPLGLMLCAHHDLFTSYLGLVETHSLRRQPGNPVGLSELSELFPGPGMHVCG